VVTNNGPDSVPDAVLQDPTPSGLAFVSATGTCASGFPCTLAPLPSGSSASIGVTYLVNPQFEGTVVNVVSVASSTVPDPTPNNNASSATTVVVGNAPIETLKVPVDARWMLILMMIVLAFAGAPHVRRRDRGK
jgi:hypothetical protein